MLINILDILKKKLFFLDEAVLWSILSCGVTLIQNKISSEDNELVLLSLENLHLTREGQLCLKKDVNNRCSRSYIMPEIVDINSEWYKANNAHKAEILLYSLGASLKKIIINRENDTSTVSDTLWSIVYHITEHNSVKRLTLPEVLRICCTKAKEFTKGRSYNYHLSQLCQSYKSTDKGSRMVRSLSQSNVTSRNPNIISLKQKSLGSIEINPDQSTRNMVFNKQSSTESENNPYYHHSGISTPSSNTSENNSKKGTLATSNYGNLILNAIDPQCNITEALERVKARRKVIKNNGPVKSPTEVSLSQSFNSSSKDLVENINKTPHSEIYQPPGLLEISTVERLGGFRHILGPEFVIRCNETFNITFTQERRNSFFARTSSGRLIRDEVMVHLLNGVVLIVRNLNNRSTINQIISSIHNTFPDLEFVTFGLCFTLESEYFFIKEDVNIYKLISYVSHKNNQVKSDEKVVALNNALHLYYRLKYYPTLETFREMNSFGRRLLYLQLRQDILNHNFPPLSMEDALYLAAVAIQAEYGNNEDNLIEDLEYLKMQNYFHRIFIPVLNISEDEISFLRKLQSKCTSLEWIESEVTFIEKVISKKYYGVHWYKVNKNQLSIVGAIGKETFLILGRHYIELVDISRTKIEIEIHKHFNYKWRQIDSITIKNKKLLIKPKMQLKVEGINASSVFVCFLDSRTKAEYIVRLCKDHHLLASQDEGINVGVNNNICNNTGSHLGLSTVDYPASLRTSIDVDDDDIFIDYASSDENTYETSEISNNMQYKLHQLKSLQNMNAPEKSDYTSNVKTDKPTKGGHYCNSNEETHPNSIVTKENQFLQLQKRNIKMDDILLENQFSDKIFEVKIARVKGESIGIGIINVKTNDIQGIFIKCVQRNSIAERCGQIIVGDEIICINNEPVSYITQEEVKTIMTNCGTHVSFLMRRHYIEDFKSSLKTSDTVELIKKSHPILSNGSNMKLEQETSACSMLKTNNSFNKCLEYSNGLEILKTKYLDIVIPPMRIKDEDYLLLHKIDRFSEKEIKGLQEKVKWNLNGKNIENNSDNRINELLVNLNILVHEKLASKINLKFLMICMKKEDNFNEEFWKMVNNNKSELVISLGSKSFDKELFWEKENLNKKYDVRVKEKCEVNETLVVRRLSLRLPNVDNQRIFQIQFCEWFNKKITPDAIVQIVNLACLLNQNIPNEGPLFIVYEDPSNKPTNFIVIYILLLLNLHSEINVDPVLNTQTLVNSIFDQLIQQCFDLVPSEVQFKLCISVLKILAPLRTHEGNSSDISDVE